MLLSGVFRRETASGFYPWGNVVSPRKRVAEGLCGWRHGNSFPMTQSAQSLRQMRSIPHCSKAVFYVFVFFIPLTIRQQSIIYPHIFSTDPENALHRWATGTKKTAFGERRLILMTTGQKWLIIRGCCFRPSQG